jgi:hypothetical protein
MSKWGGARRGRGYFGKPFSQQAYKIRHDHLKQQPRVKSIDGGGVTI